MEDKYDINFGNIVSSSLYILKHFTCKKNTEVLLKTERTTYNNKTLNDYKLTHCGRF